MRDILREHRRMQMTCKIVYFDNSCPLCAAEIGHYKRLAVGRDITFLDVSAPAPVLGADLIAVTAMRRFHVRDRHGDLHSGAAAFVQLWGALPGWRHVATVARLPGVLWVLEVLYRGFLPIRPVLSRGVGRLSRSKIRSGS